MSPEYDGKQVDILFQINLLTQPVELKVQQIMQRKRVLYELLTNPGFIDKYGYETGADEAKIKYFQYINREDQFTLVSTESGIMVGFLKPEEQPYEEILANIYNLNQVMMPVRGNDNRFQQINMTDIPKEKFCEGDILPLTRFAEIIEFLRNLAELGK